MRSNVRPSAPRRTSMPQLHSHKMQAVGAKAAALSVAVMRARFARRPTGFKRQSGRDPFQRVRPIAPVGAAAVSSGANRAQRPATPNTEQGQPPLIAPP
jgi:hypothetical protein